MSARQELSIGRSYQLSQWTNCIIYINNMEGRVTDSKERVLVHGTTACLILKPDHGANPDTFRICAGRALRPEQSTWASVVRELPQPARPRQQEMIMPETVVITGASAGVGRATAHAFAAQGAQIGLI